MTAKPVVAATDGSQESLRAVESAARESVLHGVPLRIVSAASLPKMVLLQLKPERDAVLGFVREHRDRALTAAAARAAEMAPGLLISTDPLEGPAAQAVTGSGPGALMLVVGSRGLGAFTAMVLGSVARYAGSHASCPVVVVREETAAVQRLIGVGVGDLDNCAGSLAFAFEEAALRKASLLAVHAWHAPQASISRAGTPYPPPALHAAAADAARQLTLLLDRSQRSTRRPGPPGHGARPPRPGAGRPVGPHRPDRHRQAPRPAASRLSQARRAEPRPRPGRHRAVILTAGSQVPLEVLRYAGEGPPGTPAAPARRHAWHSWLAHVRAGSPRYADSHLHTSSPGRYAGTWPGGRYLSGLGRTFGRAAHPPITVPRGVGIGRSAQPVKASRVTNE